MPLKATNVRARLWKGIDNESGEPCDTPPSPLHSFSVFISCPVAVTTPTPKALPPTRASMATCLTGRSVVPGAALPMPRTIYPRVVRAAEALAAIREARREWRALPATGVRPGAGERLEAAVRAVQPAQEAKLPADRKTAGAAVPAKASAKYIIANTTAFPAGITPAMRSATRSDIA